MQLADGRKAWRGGLLAGLAPDPLLSVSQWSDANVWLGTIQGPEPGAYRSARTPYIREIMDALSASSPVPKVVMCFAAQLGKTQCAHNFIGYTVDQVPGPLLYVQPTVELAKRISKQRLDPMIQDSEALRAKIKDRRSRDSGNTMLVKEYAGGVMVLTGANSAAGLRSMPIRYLVCDEISAWKGDIEGEGDPLWLADRGTRNFSNAKRLLVSTPGIEGRCRITKEYQASDRRRLHLPCPDCGELQVLMWANLQFERDKAGEVLADSVLYACEHCGSLIEEWQKTWMLERGVWIPDEPDRSPVCRGYWLNALNSPVGWRSWRKIAQAQGEAKGDSSRLRIWINHDLAECWNEQGEAPDWERLYRAREDYKIGTVPKGGLVLVAGVDVQKDRIEVEVIAYGRGKESWSIDYRVIPGDPTIAATWRPLADLLDESFALVGRKDAGLSIRMMAVDAGFAAQSVYGFVRPFPPNRVIAVGGRDIPVLIGQPRAVETLRSGKRARRGVKRWPVGHAVAKGELYGWLKQKPPLNPKEDGFPPGWCHFPQYEEEYFRQLTAEQLVPRIVATYRRYVWESTRPRNEALDCRVYGRAAAALLGIDRWKDEHWDRIETALGTSARKRKASGAPAKKPRRGARSDYWERHGR